VAHDDREAVETAREVPGVDRVSPQLEPLFRTYGMFVNEMPGCTPGYVDGCV
jgi:hypothetical protein